MTLRHISAGKTVSVAGSRARQLPQLIVVVMCHGSEQKTSTLSMSLSPSTIVLLSLATCIEKNHRDGQPSDHDTSVNFPPRKQPPS